jgi:hypothetical protein
MFVRKVAVHEVEWVPLPRVQAQYTAHHLLVEKKKVDMCPTLETRQMRKLVQTISVNMRENIKFMWVM